MNFELHIFTNSTVSAPSTTIIETTYESFCKCFNEEIIPIVWYDPKPNTDNADEYLINLKKIFPNVNLTTSLSDGYIKAITNSSAEFLFMLEHDWHFMPNITHSLNEICDLMTNDNIVHLRFNKRDNCPVRADKRLQEVKSSITYCITPFLSNNPHIIKKDLYLEKALPYIKNESGSKGIEQRLQKVKSIEGAIYGPLNYTNTIKHLDGRKSNK